MEQTNLNIQGSKKTGDSLMAGIRKLLFDNMVTILFVALCIAGIILSKQPAAFLVNEITVRLARNSFMVLALIIPVLAGMGLNFGIVIGAMAGQIAIIAVTHWKITGIYGFLLCVLLSTPIAVIFGYFTGRLLNKTKGQEMIASMIMGFFANGLYQFLFLFLIGTLIPMNNPVLVLSNGVGIKNTVDLSKGIKYSLDNLVKLSLDKVIIGAYIFAVALLIFAIVYYFYLYQKSNRKPGYMVNVRKYIIYIVLLTIPFIICMTNKKFNMALKFTDVPIMTILVVIFLCLFNVFILRTKLGQDFRTVGQDMHVANVAGINVNRVRITAIIISTVLAAWGQLIFLQNMGTLNTYGSHEQVGTFAIASILIGGASVSKATNTQAILGVLLFHTLFVVSPIAGKNLFNDAQIGEYFRLFIAYGVIGLSLGLYAWKKVVESRKKHNSQ